MIGKRILLFGFILISLADVHAAGFGDWVARGIVVGKTFRAPPLSHSLGVDGIYKVELRDHENRTRRQMVPRSVFLAYEVGDFFDPAASRRKEPALAQQPTKKVTAKIEPAAPLLAQNERRNRSASARFTSDMLPETEGF